MARHRRGPPSPPARPPREPAPPAAPPAPSGRWLLAAGLLLALALLLAHAARYAFQTDDAFISFRYARNLAHGHGLVFNPGYERVEGYTNFLWVVLLAGFNLLGVAPERAAQALSLAATVGLWLLLAAAAWRARAAGAPAWVALFAPLCLALDRSVAVWSTSGLETRLFELLLVAGAVRLVQELEAELAGRPPGLPLAALFFGLAELTRPVGALLRVCALGVAGALLARRGRLRPAAFAARAAPGVLLVAAHFAFRLAYYGQWLPNTYYAKVAGQTWWSLGGKYLAAFGLEYSAWAWIPLLIAAVLYHRSRASLHVPLLAGTLILPHAVYVAAVGGDHFEYRMVDFYFPLLFLLLADGLRYLAARPAWRLLALPWAVVVLAGLVELPWQSHAQFPGTWLPGFPGRARGQPEAAGFLDPGRDFLYRLPGLRLLAGLHRELLDGITEHFVGVRAEEHRMFLAAMEPEARKLAELVARGVLPRDVYVAMDCVGVVPYLSDVRTLDRLGLTDAHVAHSRSVGPQMLAHGKHATLEYARQAGVDLWDLESARLLWRADEPRLLPQLFQAERPEVEAYAARLGDGWWLLARLPQGGARARLRMPRLGLQRVDRAVTCAIAAEAVPRLQERLARSPDDAPTEDHLGRLLALTGDDAGALPILQHDAERRPESPQTWLRLAACQVRLGDVVVALRTFGAAAGQAARRGDAALAARFEAMARSLAQAAAAGDTSLRGARGAVAGVEPCPQPR